MPPIRYEEGGKREHVQHGRTSKFDELSQLWDGYSDVICVGPNCPILPCSRRGYAEATRARVYACLFCVTAGAPYHLLGLLSTLFATSSPLPLRLSRTMPPAAGAGPAPARTQLGLVAAVPATFIEARFDIDRDSPVVTSWAFIDWDVPVAPARASAPRSAVVGAILAD